MIHFNRLKASKGTKLDATGRYHLFLLAHQQPPVPVGHQWCQVSPQFRQLWQQHDIHGRCQGQRTFAIPQIGQVTFEHASFIVDEENHLRLVMYSALAGDPASAAFEALLQQ